MNIVLEEALADSNFHPQKFVNILANSKDASTLLNKYHQELTEFIEKSNERIISSFSKNHTVIMNAAREANLIENEIKDLQNLLIDQSKFISEISSAPQILPSPDASRLSQISAKLHVESSTESFVSNSIENQERIAQIEKLTKALDVVIITRKYAEIPSILNNIERFSQNFEPGLQYIYQCKINKKISEICQLIINQILNINPILLTDSFSIQSLTNVLLELKQSDLALKVYLDLITNNLTKKIANYQLKTDQTFSGFVTAVINDFFDQISKTHKYINVNFSQPNLKIIYYLSAEKMIKLIVKNLFLQASMSSTKFLDQCEHFSLILNKSKEKINELELDLYTLFRNQINIQIEASLAIYVSNHIREIEALFIKHPFIKLNRLLIEENQMEILQIDNSLALCTDDDVIPAICYLDVILKTIIKKCQIIVKSKTVMGHLEKVLYICLNQLTNLVKTSQTAPKDYRYTVEYFNKILKAFKDNYPKSNFAAKNSQAIQNITSNTQ